MSKRRIVVDLGWCMASLEPKDNGVPEQLTIVSPTYYGEGIISPASSVTVYGQGNVEKLKSLLNEVR